MSMSIDSFGISFFSRVTLYQKREVNALFIATSRKYKVLELKTGSKVDTTLMKQGEERMKREGLGDPQLKVPVRCLIDECKNVGRIPNLEGVLSFCRKYRISIVPIFQSFSQLEELYGKGPANEFLSNCDTMMFLGGQGSGDAQGDL